MKKKNKNIIILGLVIVAVVVSVNAIMQSSNSPGELDSFATCLTENEVKMFGTDWCQFCQQQKSMFGKSFKQVDYIDCDLESQECFANGIRSYPTWKVNGEYYSGVQQLNTLSSLSGCSIE